MGRRHWPDDADEVVEELELKITELEAEVERLKATERICADVDCGDFEAAMLDWKYLKEQAEAENKKLRKALEWIKDSGFCEEYGHSTLAAVVYKAIQHGTD